jgi:hypothetical protein
LLSPLASTASLLPTTDAFEVRACSGELLIRAQAESLRAFGTVPEDMRDFAVAVAVYEAHVATNEPGHLVAAAVDLFWVMLMLIVHTDGPALVNSSGSVSELRRLRRRLNFISETATRYGVRAERATAAPLTALAAARAAIAPAIRGDNGAFQRLVSQLVRTKNWATGREVTWPPI